MANYICFTDAVDEVLKANGISRTDDNWKEKQDEVIELFAISLWVDANQIDRAATIEYAKSEISEVK